MREFSGGGLPRFSDSKSRQDRIGIRSFNIFGLFTLENQLVSFRSFRFPADSVRPPGPECQ